MAEGKIKRDVDFIMDKATTATKIIFAVCVPFALIFIFLGDAVINLLYPNLGAENIMLGGKLLAISAVNILTLSVFQIYSAILQGLGKITVPVKVMGGCVIFKTILSCILIPFIGMTGAAAANTAAFLIAGGGHYGVFLPICPRCRRLG
jgi:O-antigen/teichoic acid export membrane protein